MHQNPPNSAKIIKTVGLNLREYIPHSLPALCALLAANKRIAQGFLSVTNGHPTGPKYDYIENNLEILDTSVSFKNFLLINIYIMIILY